MNNIAILVSTFDKYSACWAPFCHGLEKYWPDHPDSLFFITNQMEPPCGRAIRVGPDRGWTENLRFALQQVWEPYILYAQEDYWIRSAVNSAQIRDYLALMEQDRADYIRLFPTPAPDLDFPGDEHLGILARDAEYRTSLQMALWRKSVLQSLLLPGESPWEFEGRGASRSRQYGSRFLCVKKASWGISYVFSAVVEGEWSKEAYTYARAEFLAVDFDGLPRQTRRTRLRKAVKNWLYRFYRPPQRKLKQLWRRLHQSVGHDVIL